MMDDLDATPRANLHRVSVDSLGALSSVKENYRVAAMARLAEKIEAEGLQKERASLVDHLNQFVERVFSITQPNLRVNGKNLEASDTGEPDMEPFDEGLDRHIWSLAADRLKRYKDISKIRRTIPPETEGIVSDLLQQERHQDEVEINSTIENDGPINETPAEVTTNYEIMRDSWYKAVALAGELNQVVASQQDRVGRLEAAEAAVKGLKA